jgi:hypothetical protein
MIGLIVSMVGGVLVGVLALMLGLATGGDAAWFGLGGAIAVFAALSALTTGRVPREQDRLPVLFPTPDPTAPGDQPAS